MLTVYCSTEALHLHDAGVDAAQQLRALPHAFLVVVHQLVHVLLRWRIAW
jgi:hypothetical protein